MILVFSLHTLLDQSEFVNRRVALNGRISLCMDWCALE